MKIPTRCDVVVIGGGPGGAIASALLSQSGFDVVLFDKAKHPRYAVGESLIPHFWKYCEYAGVADKVAAEGFIQKSGGTVSWDGVLRQMSFGDFGYKRPALHVERETFDHILLEHARAEGVRVFEEVSVLEVDPADGQSKVQVRPVGERGAAEVSCRFVIDASGQAAVIARQMGTRIIDEGFRFMSIWGYFDDSKYVAGDGRAYDFERLSDIPPTTFVSNVDRWGWLWHIPQRESTSVGLVLPQDQMKSIRESDEALEEHFVRKCREIPIADRLLADARYCEGSFHVIRDYSFRPTSVAGPGYFQIGDAAAFTDPIFSVGVVLAMYSAYLAHWAIQRSFKTPSRTADNRAIFSQQFRTRIEASRALALPRYGYGGEDGEMVETAINFETALEQELMHVVSTLTTRSENFEKMSRNRPTGKTITSDKYRVLEEIAF